MTINKTSKNRKARGGTTHGYGSMKKHRGAGHRGGRGRAGSGKRGDAKKPRYWKDKKCFGKFGFKTKQSVMIKKSINIKDLEDNKENWLKKGMIKKDGDKLMVNLTKLGYDKLLSTGEIKSKFFIDVSQASQKALEKVQKAGGAVKTVQKADTKTDKPDADTTKSSDEKKEDKKEESLASESADKSA